MQVRRKAPHELDLSSIDLPEHNNVIDYGLPPLQLAASHRRYLVTLSKHISDWVRHACRCPMKGQRSVFTAGLTSMLPLVCSKTLHACIAQAQNMDYYIRPIEMQYPAAADLLGQLLYLDPLQRLSAAQALQHAWFHQT